MNKQFVIKKYVMAETAAEALRIEHKYPADDCWIDDDWKKANEATWKEIGYNAGKRRKD